MAQTLLRAARSWKITVCSAVAAACFCSAPHAALAAHTAFRPPQEQQQDLPSGNSSYLRRAGRSADSPLLKYAADFFPGYWNRCTVFEAAEERLFVTALIDALYSPNDQSPLHAGRLGTQSSDRAVSPKEIADAPDSLAERISSLRQDELFRRHWLNTSEIWSAAQPGIWLQKDAAVLPSKFDYDSPISVEKQSSWWGSYIYSRAKITDRDSDYTIQSNGFSLGYTRRTSATDESGVTVSYSRPEVSQHADSTTGRAFYVGLHSQHSLGSGFAGSIWLGMGKQNYKYDEELTRAFGGTLDGTTHEFALELNKSFQLGEYALLRPAVGFSYSRIEQDSFEENTAGKDLWVDGKSYDAALMRFGFYIDRYSAAARWHARAFYNRRISGDDLSPLAGTFYSSETRSRALGALIDEDSFSVGIGLELKLNKEADSMCFLDYEAEFSDSTDVHKMRAGYKLLF
ncbi:MAG: autotransporter outer membrane beta-barrel domain-containing protein [Pyramidobacter sp.]|nr:autotransporter outer membrane beta-barrel domain-containing protein [Pyramidobacter sp.]